GAGGVVGRGRGRRSLVEVLRLGEGLRGQARADDPAVELDQTAVRLARERELRKARKESRDREPEHERDQRDDDRGCPQVAQHQCDSPSTSGPSVSAGKSIRPAVSMITPTSRNAKVGPSVRNVPAENGAIFLPASEPASASAASSGTKRPSSSATVPT